jgi:hypothetical protein
VRPGSLAAERNEIERTAALHRSQTPQRGGFSSPK